MTRRILRALVVAAGASLALACAAAAAPAPACFGAAARDPERPCRNPGLRLSVVPTPADAQLIPNLPCTRIETIGAGTILRGAVGICAFGVPPVQAAETVALVGDSHAMNWQAPLDVAAQAKGWRVLAITRSHCPFSRAVRRLPEPDRSGCVRWNGRITRWFRAHPEIGVAFFAQMNGGRTTLLTAGDQFAAAVAGYRRAWRALPPSVERIVVIRDQPSAEVATPRCVMRAVARRRSPGAACALPRAEALPPDPAVVAAAGMRRVRVVDLTPHMCDRRRCFPVVGGVLVHKDGSHLTTPFATSLGPFLLRSVERLLARGR